MIEGRCTSINGQGSVMSLKVSIGALGINGQGSVMSLKVSIGALGINGQGLMHSSRLWVLMV